MMQPADRPLFRQDLLAEAVDEQGVKYVDVADPDNGQLFRFYEAEFALLCGMDGQRDVASIVKWAAEELGLKTTPAEVKNVISTLVDRGFLEHGRDVVHAQPRPAEPELAPGIVVGQRGKPSPSIDLEIGPAGGSAPVDKGMPKAPQLELGHAGSATAATTPKAPVEDFTLGAPGKVEAPSSTDISLDLADQMAISRNEVKEAIRQSRVMAAVEVPPELQSALDDKPPPAQVKAPEPAPEPVAKPPEKQPVQAKQPEPVAKPPEKQPAKQPEKQPEKQPVAKQPEKQPTKQPAKQPEKQPEKQPVAKQPEKQPVGKQPEKQPGKQPEKAATDKQPVKPTPKSGISPVLVILLILVVGGAAAFLGWKYVLNKSDDKQQTGAVTPTPPTTPVAVAPGSAAVVEEPPPSRRGPLAKFANETPAERQIMSIHNGRLEWVDQVGKEVKSGDVVGKLAGSARLEGEIKNIETQIERVTRELEAATKERDNAQAAGNAQAVTLAEQKMKDRQGSLEKKQESVEKKKEELERFKIYARDDGKLTAVAKVGTAIGDTTEVAKIQPVNRITATFPSETKIDKGIAVVVYLGDKPITCSVLESTETEMKVGNCPPEITDGTEARLHLSE